MAAFLDFPGKFRIVPQGAAATHHGNAAGRVEAGRKPLERAAAIGVAGIVIDRKAEVASEVDEEQRSEEHTSELQSLMRISYAVFCLKKKKKRTRTQDS